ncbi:MAG: bifunctional DNA-formamidopyrimidine glycosylase/DNA-(apurinic or apyrimidinic site) lyase [Victivallales bacterium]|jgi:formamidopyrimidine-DNA glycosylase|nr:bifunctional DNA-formamidopyrimidine glycosylase/DNA-(apurinic or apyrimidinic site) lyase [Victivallales bacterium]
MPELPEAENIARALSRVLTGRTITQVEVFSPAMREPLTPLLTAGLEGKSLLDIRRRGRYVIAELSDGRVLLMHFGMSGVVRVEGGNIAKRKHEHVFLHLDDGKIFRFECTRRFSLLKVCALPCAGGIPAELDKFGPEPLSDEFNGEYLYRVSRGKSSPVKSFIMDNAIVPGIGNIYATETLFGVGISPLRPAGKLTRKECDLLIQESKKILHRAIELGGSSISDFLNVDGSEGKFAQELKIYGKTGQACVQCGAKILSARIGGRTSAYCPCCQH